jgi:hypothetical protein
MVFCNGIWMYIMYTRPYAMTAAGRIEGRLKKSLRHPCNAIVLFTERHSAQAMSVSSLCGCSLLGCIGAGTVLAWRRRETHVSDRLRRCWDMLYVKLPRTEIVKNKTKTRQKKTISCAEARHVSYSDFSKAKSTILTKFRL